MSCAHRVLHFDWGSEGEKEGRERGVWRVSITIRWRISECGVLCGFAAGGMQVAQIQHGSALPLLPVVQGVRACSELQTMRLIRGCLSEPGAASCFIVYELRRQGVAVAGGGLRGGKRARVLARVHNNQMAHQRVWSSLRFCSWWRAGGADTALIAVAIVAGFAARTRVQPFVGNASHLLLLFDRGKCFMLHCV